MANVPRFRSGRVIRAGHLNQAVDAINALARDELPKQKEPGDERPLVDDDDQTESEESYGAETWVEVSRTTATVRVENPEDSEQYVDVSRVQTITLRKPDGTYIKLTLSNS